MPETLFRPQLDNYFPINTWKLYRSEMTSIRSLLSQCRSLVIKELQNEFSESIELEDVLDQLKRWIRMTSDDCLPQVAISIVVLDYFLTRSVIPNPFGERERDYLLKRLKATLQKNMARSLAWKIVMDLIPGTHHISSVLVRQVEDEVMRSGFFENVEVEIDLKIPDGIDLNLPGKGGAGWLRGQTVQEWKKIKSSIDSGKPCLIELIRESSDRNAGEVYIVVAFRYDISAHNITTIEVFDPRNSARKTIISVIFQAEELEFTEMPSLVESQPIRGMLVWDYRRKLPPIRGWYAWFHRFLVPTFWWRRQRQKAVMQIDSI